MPGVLWIESGALLDPALPLSRAEMRPLLKRLLAALDLSGASLEVRFVDDAEMARLNASHLGLPGPTNVLSFPAEDPERPDYLGELALSVDTLRREATLYGQPPEEHLIRLLAHGLLHLAGYEHGPNMEAMTDMAVASVHGA